MKPLGGDRIDESLDAVRRAAYEWQLRLENEAASPARHRAFEAWLDADPRHAAVYERSVTVWAALGSLRPERLAEASRRPSRRERVLAFAQRGLTAVSAPRARLAVGACALIGIGVLAASLLRNAPAAPAPEPLIASYSTPTGELRVVRLADGTTATLGAATAIETRITHKARQVALTSGAALFDVSADPDRPFSVRAGPMTATAIGTSFDVRNNGGVVRVGVAAGAVRVSYPLPIAGRVSGIVATQTLRAGQQIAATPSEGLREAQSGAAGAIAAWRERRLVYAGATLSELVADANRYSTRKIEIEQGSAAISSLKVTVSYDSADIEGMLSTLPELFPVTLDRIDARTLLIRAREAPAP